MSAPPPATKRAASWFGRSRSSTPQPDAVPQLTKQLEDTEIDSPGEAVEPGEDETITADDLGVADELQGDTETEQGECTDRWDRLIGVRCRRNRRRTCVAARGKGYQLTSSFSRPRR